MEKQIDIKTDIKENNKLYDIKKYEKLIKDLKIQDISNLYQFLLYLIKTSTIRDENEKQAIIDKIFGFIILIYDFDYYNKEKDKLITNSKVSSTQLLDVLKATLFYSFLVKFNTVNEFVYSIFVVLSIDEVSVSNIFDTEKIKLDVATSISSENTSNAINVDLNLNTKMKKKNNNNVTETNDKVISCVRFSELFLGLNKDNNNDLNSTILNDKITAKLTNETKNNKVEVLSQILLNLKPIFHYNSKFSEFNDTILLNDSYLIYLHPKFLKIYTSLFEKNLIQVINTFITDLDVRYKVFNENEENNKSIQLVNSNISYYSNEYTELVKNYLANINQTIAIKQVKKLIYNFPEYTCYPIELPTLNNINNNINDSIKQNIEFVVKSIINYSLINNENGFLLSILNIRKDLINDSLKRAYELSEYKTLEFIIKKLNYFDSEYWSIVQAHNRKKAFGFHYGNIIKGSSDFFSSVNIFKSNNDIIFMLIAKLYSDYKCCGKNEDKILQVKRINYVLSLLFESSCCNNNDIEDDKSKLDKNNKLNRLIEYLSKSDCYEEILNNQSIILRSIVKNNENKDTNDTVYDENNSNLFFAESEINHFTSITPGTFTLSEEYFNKILIINKESNIDLLEDFINKNLKINILSNDKGEYTNSLIIGMDTETEIQLVEDINIKPNNLIQLSITTKEYFEEIKNTTSQYLNSKEAKDKSLLSNLQIVTLLINTDFLNKLSSLSSSSTSNETVNDTDNLTNISLNKLKETLSMLIIKSNALLGFDLKFDLKHLIPYVNKEAEKKLLNSNINCKDSIIVDFSYSNSIKKKESLKSLLKKEIDIEICKACQISSWTGELFKQQIHYATIDSYILIVLYSKLISSLK